MKNKIRTLLSLAAGFALAGSANAALKIGDPAPKLQVASWAQGEPVKEFEPGKVYIVEFWATWCGPCRASIPQINALYQQFKDKGVVVIGQNVREEDETGVAPFIKKMGTNMTYRVALDDKSTETNGAMLTAWMEAADRHGIPCAFIINKKGVVAWIGHPMEMTEKLWEDVLTDHYDMAKAAADYDKEQAVQGQIMKLSATFTDAMKNEKWDDANVAVDALAKAMPEDQLTPQMMRMDLLFAQKKYDEGYRVAASVSEANPDNAGLQNTLAWTLAMRPGLQKRDLALAEKIAERGNKAAMEKDAHILDTLARIQFMNGKKDEAIATQQKAVDAADSSSQGAMKMTLERYQGDKSSGGGE
ncbi:MAG TPA: redoxin family protein [Verrucomicrobiae bacterium]|jgi:thiol-disulfide isomerase/thioredoxin